MGAKDARGDDGRNESPSTRGEPRLFFGIRETRDAANGVVAVDEIEAQR
jgi:hypothetical protein